MKFQLVRNATVKIEYAGKNWLIDPFFGEMNSLPSFAGKSLNPTVPLPFSPSGILKDVDYILITHLHPDHFDEKAQETIPKSTPFIVQKPDAETIKELGFQNVKVIDELLKIDTIKISRVNAQHGEGDILKVMGTVSGYVFEAPNEETLYITGDTIWCETVKHNLDMFNPKIIFSNAGGNIFEPETNPFKNHITLKRTHKVIMDEEGVLKMLDYKNDTTIIACHIGALDHDTVSRKSLKTFLESNNVNMERVFIPEDGEIIDFI